MIGRAVVIDKLLAEALGDYVRQVERLQHSLGGFTDMAVLHGLQNRTNEAGQRVAHLVVCSLVGTDGAGEGRADAATAPARRWLDGALASDRCPRCYHDVLSAGLDALDGKVTP